MFVLAAPCSKFSETIKKTPLSIGESCTIHLDSPHCRSGACFACAVKWIGEEAGSILAAGDCVAFPWNGGLSLIKREPYL